MLTGFEILTADVDRVSERCCYLRVKVNYQAAMFSNRVIASFNALLDPQLERILDNSEDDVHNELSGQAVHVTLVRQVLRNMLMLHATLHDVFDAESFVEWHMQHPDVCSFDIYCNVKL